MWHKRQYEDSDKLWNTLKEEMKRNSDKVIDIEYLEKISKDQNSSRNSSPIGTFANDIKNELRDKHTREDRNKKFQEIMEQLLKKRKSNTDIFIIEEGKIKYEAKYKNVKNKSTLEEQIKNSIDGVLVDDDLLYFTTINYVKKEIQKLSDGKKIKMVKAGGTTEKQKKQSNKPQNYRLFAMELESKEPVLKELLQFQKQFGKKDQELKQLKIKTLFQRSYTENQTHINERQTQEIESFDRSGNMGSEDHNRRNVRNYQELKEEWLKKQRK